jgi:hypothetical protein
MSLFDFDGIHYLYEPDFAEERDINISLRKLNLQQKDTFVHLYDMGSTTTLLIEVYSIRSGYLKNNIEVLARNTLPEYQCSNCEKNATLICLDCYDLYCDDCLEEHSCYDEDMVLPVVNSPRMGVCAYGD